MNTLSDGVWGSDRLKDIAEINEISLGASTPGGTV